MVAYRTTNGHGRCAVAKASQTVRVRQRAANKAGSEAVQAYANNGWWGEGNARRRRVVVCVQRMANQLMSMWHPPRSPQNGLRRSLPTNTIINNQQFTMSERTICAQNHAQRKCAKRMRGVCKRSKEPRRKRVRQPEDAVRRGVCMAVYAGANQTVRGVWREPTGAALWRRARCRESSHKMPACPPA